MGQGWDYLRGKPGAERAHPDLDAARRALAEKEAQERSSNAATQSLANVQPSEVLSRLPEDTVGSALQLVGGTLFAISVIVIVAGVADSSADTGLVVLIGVAGLVQSLLLIGFGRVVTYTKATALLLAEAVDQQRAE